MKYKLGNQRPLDIREPRAKFTPSIVGVAFVAPLLLILAGLFGHFAVQAMKLGARIVVPVALGIASLFVVWGVVALLPSPNPDRP